MCKAFSGVILRSGKVYWKTGMDEHNNLKKHFILADDNPQQQRYCPFEITPENNNYVFPDKWNFKFDDECPDWWKKSHELACWAAHKKWHKEVLGRIYVDRLRNLVNPFELPMVEKVTKEHINLLKKWDSVNESVGGSVGDSVRASVGDSVGISVGTSVWNSVEASIRAYIGSIFKLKEWKYTEKIKTKNYPFSSAVKLWEQGLVPSFDGKIWRLHSGKKAKIIYEITQEKLRNLNVASKILK